MKPWRCGAGHVLGQVARNGRGTRRLLIYRQAVDMEQEIPEEVDVIGVAEGLLIDVRCSICGRARTWTPGEEAMRELLERVQNKQVYGREK